MELDKEINFDKIIEFKNLKTLKLNDFSLTKLPEVFDKLNKLELFSVNYFDNLEKLPNSLSKITTLNEIQISDCKKLSGLEELIPLLKNLKRVYSRNYNFRKDYTKQLKTKRPNLIIDDWTSGGEFIDSYIEEETPSTPPPPPPPPQSPPSSPPPPPSSPLKKNK